MEVSLKDSQIQAIHRLLAFNDENATAYENEYALPPAGSSQNQWKILVYDAHCRAIISPILPVAQLRRRGVTLHLLLDSEREAIPDVPAVYFCRPTRENLAIIAQDCAKGLYARAHLNFVTKLERELMEEFARLVVQTGSLELVQSVHDQYIDFICCENRLFCLQTKDAYTLYNGAAATEEQVEKAMTDIAYGLFSVVATLGAIPIIRCPRGGAPEMVARKLNKMIMEHPTMLRNQSAKTRPLLVILDRNSDLITPVQHTSTYQALIDDLLQHRSNKVEFDLVKDPDAKRPHKDHKAFNLEPDTDPFYSAHKFLPFPEAIEANDSELKEVTRRESGIKSKTSGKASAVDPLSTGTTDLANAVDSLPALLAKKKDLEKHTSILQGVMNAVASRDIPQFYELESTLATGAYKNDPASAKKEVIALVGDSEKGNIIDKVRLCTVFALTSGAKPHDMEEITAALQQASETAAAGDKNARESLATGLKALSYLKQLRATNMLPTSADMMQELQSEAKTDSSSTMLSSLMAKASTQATGIFARASDKVLSMLGKTHKHHATVVLENLCEMKPGSEDESYLYLDPKVKGDVNVQKLQNVSRASVREAICFMIGGGCYGEYQNLQMLADERRKISYGSTELLDATSFVSQLAKLG